jgi:phage terminase large subunit
MSNPLERYQNDPCAFVREILGVATNYPKQDEILRSVRDNPRTALRTGNGCGKTVVAAQTVLWAAACFPDALVITTIESCII